MLAYGRWHYEYATGREGDWFRIGMASNKNYISLYISAGDKCGYIAEQYEGSASQSKYWAALRAVQAAERSGSDGAEEDDPAWDADGGETLKAFT
jgi:hypothetical protein